MAQVRSRDFDAGVRVHGEAEHGVAHRLVGDVVKAQCDLITRPRSSHGDAGFIEQLDQFDPDLARTPSHGPAVVCAVAEGLGEVLVDDLSGCSDVDQLAVVEQRDLVAQRAHRRKVV